MSQRILFHLSPKSLIVANTGKPFTKKGFESVCYTDTSAKKTNLSIEASSEQEAQSWISEVICKKRTTFGDLNQLHSASGTEQRTAKDYDGRLILELLQNAIDAGLDEQIGYKGIGIRSILNQSKILEVHSGNLHVRWSKEDAISILKELGDPPETLPILDLPAWCDVDDEIQKLLEQNYQTVIRLKLTDQGSQYIKKEWKKFSNDPSILLFINNDIDVRWEFEENTQIQWRSHQAGEVVTIKLNNSKTIRWCKFGSYGAMAAYAVDENLKFRHSEETAPRLRTFFTADQSPHPFPNLYLHHAKFKLKSDRQTIVIDDRRLREITNAIVLAAESIQKESDVLDLLQINQIESMDTLRSETRIWKAVQPVLAKKKLKSLKERCLSDIKSCPKNEDLPHDWKGENRWQFWEAFLSALKEERLNGLSGLPVLQPGTENERREKTLCEFNPKCFFSKKELRQQPWAPVGESNEPVSSSIIKIFLPHKGPAIQPPEGIEVRFLTSEFVNAFKNRTELKVEDFLKGTMGVQKFSALGVIEHCVLPSSFLIQRSAAPKKLIKFLKELREADANEIKKPVEFFDWNDSIRCRLVQQLHLECQNNLWPLFRVYASKRWTGNSFLENIYGESRGFLETIPHENEEEKKSWTNFWKWLGVGWCPKVMPLLENVTCKSKDHQGLLWGGEIFQGPFFQRGPMPKRWRNYCKALMGFTSFTDWNYSPRIKENWTIDGGYDVLTKPDTFAIIGSNWSVYKRWVKAKICCSSNQREDFDNSPSGTLPSYLIWLIQETPWIPDSKGCIYKGNEIFHKNGPVVKGVSQFVAMLEIPKERDLYKNTFPPDFFRSCGIRNGWKEVEDTDWRSWLKKASEIQVDGNDSANKREAIRMLYRSLLEHRRLITVNQFDKSPIEPIDNMSLWGIECLDGTHKTWRLHKTADPLPYFIDRGDLANMMLPGLWVFPVRLDGLADKAAKHLSIKPLSKVLSGTPTNNGNLVSKYSDSTKDRINELVAYLRLDDELQYNDSQLKQALCAVTLRQVPELCVHFSLNGSPINGVFHHTQFHQKNDDNFWTAYVDEANCSDERRWEVFAETLLLSCSLRIDKRKEVRDLLRYKHEELHEELLRLGVAPEAIQNLQQESPLTPMEPEPIEPVTPPFPGPNGDPPVVIPPPEKPNGVGGDTGGGGTGSGINGGGPIQPPRRPHPEEGMKAQYWLYEKVKHWCLSQTLPEPLWEKDKNDITIEVNPPILIEVKRIEGRVVHWSSIQIKKAFSHGTRYVVALLRPHKGKGYEVFWVLSPLDQFGILPSKLRHVEWRWKVEKGAAYDQGSWYLPQPRPLKEADRFNAVISLPNEWEEGLARGVKDGLRRIISSNGIEIKRK